MEFGCPPQKIEGGDQTKETEAVVAMKMGDEYMAQAGKFESGPTHLELGSLATIYHKEFVAHVEHLRGRVMTGCGQCRATT